MMFAELITESSANYRKDISQIKDVQRKQFIALF